MPPNLGRAVLKSKAEMSHDQNSNLGQSVRMKKNAESGFQANFIGRVRAAHAQRFETTTAGATALGMDQGRYKQYLTRTPLPIEIIEQFCVICGVTVEWLVTGKGAGPKWEAYEHAPNQRTRSVSADRRKAS